LINYSNKKALQEIEGFSNKNEAFTS